jgi:tryptophan 2,3-dioxygenase
MKKNRTFKKKRTFIKKRTFRKYRGLYNKYTNLTHKIKGGARIFPHLREKVQKFFSRGKKIEPGIEIEPGLIISEQLFRRLEREALGYNDSYDMLTLSKLYHKNENSLDRQGIRLEKDMESIFQDPTISSAKKDEIISTYKTAVEQAKERWKISGDWMQSMIDIANAMRDGYREAGLVPIIVNTREYDESPTSSSSRSTSHRISPRESPTQYHEIEPGLIISEGHFRKLEKQAHRDGNSSVSNVYHFYRDKLDRRGIELEKELLEAFFKDPSISSATKDEIITTYKRVVEEAKERWKISGDWLQAMIDIANAMRSAYISAGLVRVEINTREVAESPTSSSPRSNLSTPRTPSPTGMKTKANDWRAKSAIFGAVNYKYKDQI